MGRPLSFGIALVTALPWIAGCATKASPREPATGPSPVIQLRAPESFDSIADTGDRSRALFLEVSRVLLHPRCKNCHPRGDSPSQGDDGVTHDPPVSRGPNDEGVPALQCATCHQDKNPELARVPGAPEWRLAPLSMAWSGRSPSAICGQMKDPARNGGRTLAQIVDHAANDRIVAWGWDPGHGRTPAPGTQASFAALVAAWVETGAACPPEEAAR